MSECFNVHIGQISNTSDSRPLSVSHESCESGEMVSVDPWDMLNNFCFHLYAQKSLFI